MSFSLNKFVRSKVNQAKPLLIIRDIEVVIYRRMFEFVFVYGTLKKNGPSHYLLENSENGEAHFVCEAKTKERFPLIVRTEYEIPFILDQTGIGNVKLLQILS